MARGSLSAGAAGWAKREGEGEGEGAVEGNGGARRDGLRKCCVLLCAVSDVVQLLH